MFLRNVRLAGPERSSAPVERPMVLAGNSDHPWYLLMALPRAIGNAHDLFGIERPGERQKVLVGLSVEHLVTSAVAVGRRTSFWWNEARARIARGRPKTLGV